MQLVLKKNINIFQSKKEEIEKKEIHQKLEQLALETHRRQQHIEEEKEYLTSR